MAVSNNPYEAWKKIRSSSDYRNTDTQITSLVRQQLSQAEYLKTSNRVNPGPYRNLRAKFADSSLQSSHILTNEDMWGWQRWTEKNLYLDEAELSENLFEVTDSMTREEEQTIDLGLDKPITTPIIKSKYAKVVFEFTQSRPSDEWVIIHNLGFYPSVELFNSDRSEIDGDVIHLNVNTLKVKFNLPITGFARLN